MGVHHTSFGLPRPFRSRVRSMHVTDRQTDIILWCPFLGRSGVISWTEYSDHSLWQSGSAALTALVDGEWRISIPTESKPPEPYLNNRWLNPRNEAQHQIWCKSVQTGFIGKWLKYNMPVLWILCVTTGPYNATECVKDLNFLLLVTSKLQQITDANVSQKNTSTSISVSFFFTNLFIISLWITILFTAFFLLLCKNNITSRRTTNNYIFEYFLLIFTDFF